MTEIIISKATTIADSLDKCLELEWLETNGLGGYSSSTILNCHTRRYHGLLVAQLTQPPGKYVLFSKLDDILWYDNKEYYLTTHQYSGCTQEGGYAFFESFRQETQPTFYYRCGDITLIKKILLLQEEDTVLIKYQLQYSPLIKQEVLQQIRIHLRPFIASRDFHALSIENTHLKTEIVPCKKGIMISPYESLPSLYFQANSEFEFHYAPDWYRNFEYYKEKQRGYDCREDLFTPGVMTLNFMGNNAVIFSCSTHEQQDDLAVLWAKEVKRRTEYIKKITDGSFKTLLKTTAMQFVVNKPLDQHSIIAGYHWFSEWGRDAMVSLPGLTLYSGQEKLCLSVLKYFAAYEEQGLIPNFISHDHERYLYNAADASLWFCWAVQQYYLKTHDLEAIEQSLWDTLKRIFNYYQAGTLFGIRQNAEGLIVVDNPTVNLTWMDAMVNKVLVIPRNGAQVEINALWYNALCFINELAKKLHDPLRKRIKPLIKPLKKSFRKTFWDKRLGYLKDFVNEQQENTAIRPNQIFAISLPYSPLTKTTAKKIIHVVTEHLLTPFGLRTLSPQDVNYHGLYQGGSGERDSAYHQGTVWPWLLGHFGEAVIKTLTKRQASKLLEPCISALQLHLSSQAGLGSISEIFDGDLPHRPHGCISQAWSVAELIRLIHLMEEKLANKKNE